MASARDLASDDLAAPRRSVASILGRIALHIAFLGIAVAAFAAYEHFKLNGQTQQSLVSLLVAAGFGFAPVRALVREIFALEGKVLHLVHGVGGLALVGLGLLGVASGGPLLSHAALAPFAMMGAAQAVMHQDRPRNAQQAAALRRFATSLPEVQQFTKSGDLTSPENVRRAVVVLSDILAKAQALGETELRSDPGFQSALRQATARFGLSLGLDSIDQAIGRLSAYPAAANALPELRSQLARARKTLEEK